MTLQQQVAEEHPQQHPTASANRPLRFGTGHPSAGVPGLEMGAHSHGLFFRRVLRCKGQRRMTLFSSQPTRCCSLAAVANQRTPSWDPSPLGFTLRRNRKTAATLALLFCTRASRAACTPWNHDKCTFFSYPGFRKCPSCTRGFTQPTPCRWQVGAP